MNNTYKNFSALEKAQIINRALIKIVELTRMKNETDDKELQKFFAEQINYQNNKINDLKK